MLYAFPFILGYISHLISDSLNPTGVNWLWPWNPEKIGIASIRTGSEEEMLFHNVLLFSEAGIIVFNTLYQGVLFSNEVVNSFTALAVSLATFNGSGIEP